MTATIVQQAHGLAQAGRAAEACDLLSRATEQGDAGPMLLLGLWLIEGSAVPRDLVAARSLLGRAAAAGQQSAGRIEAALRATGVGAPADWPGAMAMLDLWADRDPLAARQRSLIAAMDLDEAGDPRSLPRREPLSDTPSVTRAEALFDNAECALLIDLAAGRFKPARIFHEGEQRFQIDPVRDSESAAFPLIFETPFVHALNRRIARLTDSASAQGEPLQLLRYAPGQQYRLHVDAVPGLSNQRVMTVLVYLNDDYDGGATSFPDLGISHRGRRGDALIFTNILPNGAPDPAARHRGEPITRGTKIVASRWIRRAPPPPGESFGPHEAEPGGA